MGISKLYLPCFEESSLERCSIFILVDEKYSFIQIHMIPSPTFVAI